MLLTLRGFSGVAPRVDPKALADTRAQAALNTKLWSGKLESLLGGLSSSTIVGRPGVKKKLYKAPSGHWFSWLTEADAVRSLIAGDTTGRVYFTGDGLPKYTDTALATGGTPYPFAAYNLGVPAPVQAAVATLGGVGTGDVETRAYVYTHVRNHNGFVDESAPSPVVLKDWQSGNTVTLGSFDVPPAGAYNVTHRRIYRTATGEQGTHYYFVGEQVIASTTFLDNVAGSALGEVLPSIDWHTPPDGLAGLVELANGVLAGFSGKDVYFSVPWRPYAWPVQYSQTSAYDIVGLAALGQALVVLTKGNPYLLSGSHPDSMSMERVPLEQACVSKRSIVSFDGGVIYAAPDGLMLVSTAGSRILTQEYLTKKEWYALCDPTTIHGYWHDGRYYGFHSTGGFIFDPSDATGALTLHNIVATAGHVDLQDDALYYVVGDTIYKLHAGTVLAYTWKSKKFQLPKPKNFAFGQVIADDYASLTFKLYADGTLKHTQAVASAKPFALPSGYKARYIEVELSGTSAVTDAHLSETAMELANV